MEQSEFPKYLLEKPTQERIEYFKNYTMAHPHLVNTFQTIKKTVGQPKPNRYEVGKNLDE